MKLTGDNIDDYKLTKKGDRLKHRDKRSYYYLNESCKVCKEPYISTQKHSEYCSSKCRPKNTIIKHSFEDVKNFVESIPLKLLSNDYENLSTPLEVQCPTCGYIWYPSYGNLKKGQTGCAKCLGRYTPSWNDIISLFDSYGFELLSKEEEFKSANHSKLRFKCKKCDYEGTTKYSEIKYKGRKCDTCNGRNTRPFTFEEIKKWFEDEEWVVHSTKEDYKSQNTTPIDCSCPNGHRQLKSVRKWRLGRRCVYCTTSGPELAFRKEIEKLNYEVIFNDRKALNGLELDFYFPESNKAIEFNGDFWHCNYDRYDCNYFNKHKGLYASELWVKDAIKKRKCKKNGIDLITIWDSYWQDCKEDTMNYIQTFLKA